MERGTHSKEVLLRELINLSECGQHPNIVQLRVRAVNLALATWLRSRLLRPHTNADPTDRSACVLRRAF